MLITFEILATACGLTQAIFVMFNKRANWIFYILQMIFMIIFSKMSHLYGDMANSCVYLIIGIISYIIWGINQKPIKFASTIERINWIIILIIGTIIGSVILSKTNDPCSILDSFTTVSSFIATILMVRRKIDAWIVWFINDIAYCIEYLILPNQAFYLFSLHCIWTAMAVVSFFTWNNIRIREENQ